MDDRKMFEQGVRLALEMGLRLKIELEGVDIPLESTFCGLVDNYLIITPPSPYHQVQHKLFDGAEMVVRYFYQGTIYAFQTKLFAQTEKPVKLLLVHYPKLIQKSELRSEKRSCCYIQAMISVGDKVNEGTIVDLARSGCHILVRGKNNKRLINFRIDDKVKLTCKFPGVKNTVEILGEVRNVRNNRYEMNLGLQFHEDTSEFTNKVISWYLATIEQFVPTQEITLNL